MAVPNDGGTPRAAHVFGSPFSQRIALETVQEIGKTSRKAQKRL
jgi:hypothetical protein